MQTMIDWLIDWLWACPHVNESWPIHDKRICLDCGHERQYFLLHNFPRDPLARKTRQAC